MKSILSANQHTVAFFDTSVYRKDLYRELIRLYEGDRLELDEETENYQKEWNKLNKSYDEYISFNLSLVNKIQKNDPAGLNLAAKKFMERYLEHTYKFHRQTRKTVKNLEYVTSLPKEVFEILSDNLKLVSEGEIQNLANGTYQFVGTTLDNYQYIQYASHSVLFNPSKTLLEALQFSDYKYKIVIERKDTVFLDVVAEFI